MSNYKSPLTRICNLDLIFQHGLLPTWSRQVPVIIKYVFPIEEGVTVIEAGLNNDKVIEAVRLQRGQ